MTAQTSLFDPDDSSTPTVEILARLIEIGEDSRSLVDRASSIIGRVLRGAKEHEQDSVDAKIWLNDLFIRKRSLVDRAETIIHYLALDVGEDARAEVAATRVTDGARRVHSGDLEKWFSDYESRKGRK